MIRKTISLWLLPIMFLSFTAAYGQQPVAEKPVFAPGDVWRYDFKNRRYAKPGCQYEMLVEQVTDANVFARVTFPEECNVSVTTAYPIASGSLQKFDLSLNHFFYSAESYRVFDFPIYVGKSWSQKWLFKINGWTYDDDVVGTVEAFEKVTTAAGTFDAYRIHIVRTYLGTQTGRPTQSGKLHDTFWYSPQVKNFVKRTYVDSGWSHITRELVDFSVR